MIVGNLAGQPVWSKRLRQVLRNAGFVVLNSQRRPLHRGGFTPLWTPNQIQRDDRVRQLRQRLAVRHTATFF